MYTHMVQRQTIFTNNLYLQHYLPELPFPCVYFLDPFCVLAFFGLMGKCTTFVYKGKYTGSPGIDDDNNTKREENVRALLSLSLSFSPNRRIVKDPRPPKVVFLSWLNLDTITP